LSHEGFELVSHRGSVADFKDPAEVARVHAAEIQRLLLEVSGADDMGRPIRRFAHYNVWRALSAPSRASIEMRGIAYWYG
jgi:hypothetical protein